MARVTETVHLTARIPESLHKSLEAIAKSDDRSVSYEVRRALKEYVERHGRRKAS